MPALIVFWAQRGALYDWTLAPLGELARALAAAFSGMVDAKYAFGFSPPMDYEGIQCRLLLTDSLRA